MWIITICAIVQCSVKDDFSSKGKTLIFDSSPDPTLWPINTKLHKINYVGQIYKCAQFIAIGWEWHFHVMVKYNSEFWAKEVPFGD